MRLSCDAEEASVVSCLKEVFFRTIKLAVSFIKALKDCTLKVVEWRPLRVNV